MPKYLFSAAWAARAITTGSTLPSLYSALRMRPIITEKAAEELRPEPAASVLRSCASKPPTCRPSSEKALIMPRTSDFGEPNSAGRTASWLILTSKGS